MCARALPTLCLVFTSTASKLRFLSFKVIKTNRIFFPFLREFFHTHSLTVLEILSPPLLTLSIPGYRFRYCTGCAIFSRGPTSTFFSLLLFILSLDTHRGSHGLGLNETVLSSRPHVPPFFFSGWPSGGIHTFSTRLSPLPLRLLSCSPVPRSCLPFEFATSTL